MSEVVGVLTGREGREVSEMVGSDRSVRGGQLVMSCMASARVTAFRS